jgi:hypothetical protein
VAFLQPYQENRYILLHDEKFQFAHGAERRAAELQASKEAALKEAKEAAAHDKEKRKAK